MYTTNHFPPFSVIFTPTPLIGQYLAYPNISPKLPKIINPWIIGRTYIDVWSLRADALIFQGNFPRASFKRIIPVAEWQRERPTKQGLRILLRGPSLSSWALIYENRDGPFVEGAPRTALLALSLSATGSGHFQNRILFPGGRSLKDTEDPAKHRETSRKKNEKGSVVMKREVCGCWFKYRV